ncbi:helix-turn-helix protein [Amycolatopsis sulphurea]|uniref:Helix-turn-helix protein n=1 Tax=Amycolatopsis sulphurea TaxID=76022 RepID=A0A2A9FAE2_9PSEU|nr:helix-turn-helix transcriptional regulator [Amycolatopsis sulphurea]PFG47923.1 helix-turn-helix protein [Amycolatopsis sulphurea]
MSDSNDLGRRIREIRSWRQLNLRTAADLAGISYSYLGQLERGERPVNNRQVLEALANALRVSPAELTDAPHVPGKQPDSQTHAALDAVEAALSEWLPGEIPDTPGRPWRQTVSDLDTLTHVLRPKSDYAGQVALLPSLITDLLHHAHGRHRDRALEGLMTAYYATGNVSGRLGRRQLSYLAGERVRASAELLDDREWLGVATWVRAQFLSSTSRQRQYKLALDAVDAPGARLESRGMGHLTAAMSAAARGDTDTAREHLDDAGKMADRVQVADSWGLATLNFTRANVGIWRVAIGTELGDGGKVAEVGRKVKWWSLPLSRQGAFWMDLGRGLMQDRRSREDGLRAILKAEALTPQQVRNNVFVREVVSDQLRRAQRDAGGRELRGLAWRMGVAPVG